MGSLGLAFVAGVLTFLSPCVLPLLPLVMGAATSEHRYGAAALGLGMTLSFVVIGLFIALVGFNIGLDSGVFRLVGGLLLVTLGLVLLSPPLQNRLSLATGPAVDWLNSRTSGPLMSGLSGQFGLGLLLGAIWSPCVGPTLGAASVLAAKGESLPQVAGVMLAFGVGAAMPLLVLGLASRQALTKWRASLLKGGMWGKAILGGVMLATGLSIVTGFDRTIEAFLVEISPTWLTRLTTRY